MEMWECGNVEMTFRNRIHQLFENEISNIRVSLYFDISAFSHFHIVSLPLINRITLVLTWWKNYIVWLCGIMRKAFDHILTKFPDHRAKIIELYRKDEDFRILCDDYLTSVQTIEEYRLKTLSDKEYESEFLRIYLDLEKEIIRLLETHAR